MRKTKIFPYLLLAPTLLILGLFVSRLLNSSIATHASANDDSQQIEQPTPLGSMVLDVPFVAEPTGDKAPTALDTATPSPTPTPAAPSPNPSPKPAQTHLPTPTIKTTLTHTAIAATKPAEVPAAAPIQPVSTPQVSPKPTSPAPVNCSGGFNQQFLCLLNQYRASQGKSVLSYNSQLAAVALGHSSWMNTNNIFSHTGINGSRLGERCAAAGVSCHAENLAKGSSSAQNLLDMWKASPPHNTNLLGPYTTMGLGVSGSYVTALWN